MKLEDFKPTILHTPSSSASFNWFNMFMKRKQKKWAESQKYWKNRRRLKAIKKRRGLWK